MKSTMPPKTNNLQHCLGNERGSSLLIAITTMTLLLALGTIYLSKSLLQYRNTATYERMLSSKLLANNAITDLMRQFSQNHYEGHYDPSLLDRGGAILLGNGYTNITITPDATNRSLYIDAVGHTGLNPDEPTSSQDLKAVVKFESDLVTHNVWIDNNLSCGVGASYAGFIMHIEGSLTLYGGNHFNVGSLIVEGNLTPNGALSTVTGDLYISGSISNPSNLDVLGSIYNYIPPEQYPAIDFAYYKNNYNMLYNGNTTITFKTDGTWDDSLGANNAIPADGAIIFVDGGIVRVSGTLRGRVTLVCNQDAYVIGNLDYANGTHSASIDDSFALIVLNSVYFCAVNLEYHGVIVTQNQRIVGTKVENSPYTLRNKLSGETNGVFSMWGTRISAMSGNMGSGFATRNYNFDPMLRQFPPPSLPEKPILTTWHIQ